MSTIKVNRTRGPAWIFKREADGSYYHHARKHIYKLFIDGGEYPDIWIGLLVDKQTRAAWVTIEREIGATSVELGRGVFVFNR